MNWARLKWKLDQLGIPLTDALFWLLLLILAGVLIWFVHWLSNRLRESNDASASREEFLNQVRELHGDGQLTSEEYRLIRSRLMKDTSQRMLGDRSVAATVANPLKESPSSEPSITPGLPGSELAMEAEVKQQDVPPQEFGGRNDSGQNHSSNGN